MMILYHPYTLILGAESDPLLDTGIWQRSSVYCAHSLDVKEKFNRKHNWMVVNLKVSLFTPSLTKRSSSKTLPLPDMNVIPSSVSKSYRRTGQSAIPTVSVQSVEKIQLLQYIINRQFCYLNLLENISSL